MEEEKRIVWKKEFEEEDDELARQGKSDDARMVRVLPPAMNSINPDLKFTT